MRVTRLLRFILQVSFGDTLLAVSILDTVHDCHLRPLFAVLKGLLIVLVGTLGLCWPEDSRLQGSCGLCPKSIARRAHLAFRGLSCW